MDKKTEEKQGHRETYTENKTRSEWSGTKHRTQTQVSTELIGYGILSCEVLICGPVTSLIKIWELFQLCRRE